MAEFKKEESLMDVSLSISPEKYFDTKFEYQEKWFSEKFNTFQAKIDADIQRVESEVKNLNGKIESETRFLDKKFTNQFKITLGSLGIIIAMMSIIIAILIH